jgi:hypothetical protein
MAHIGAHLAAEHAIRRACIYEFARVARWCTLMCADKRGLP